MAFTPITFNEGEPLDPSKLMNLQNNLVDMNSAIAGFKNSTQSETYQVQIDFGNITSIDAKANTLVDRPLKTNANLESYGDVQFIVSPSCSISNDENILTTVVLINGQPYVRMRSNKDRTSNKMSINWIATVKRTISNS
jgi:hypothetical protein